MLICSLSIVVSVSSLALPVLAKAPAICGDRKIASVVLQGFSTVQSDSIRSTIQDSCESELSESQIAGQIVRTCLRACQEKEEDEALSNDPDQDYVSKGGSPSKCRIQCLATIDRLATANRRIRTAGK